METKMPRQDMPREARDGHRIATPGSPPARSAALTQRWAVHWLRTCREMPGRAAAILDGMEQDPAAKIHAFRRLMKAWRALLKLAPPALEDRARPMRAEVKRLRQDFGADRDAVVLARTLHKLLPDAAPAEVEPAAVEPPGWRRREAVRRDLAALAAEMERWSVVGEGSGFLLDGFRRGSRKARRFLRDDLRRMPLERLHAFRSAVVDLGYQLFFFRPADPARLGPRGEAAERLRAHLGAVVDLDGARDHLARTVSGDQRRVLERDIAQRLAARRRKAARLASRLLHERPKKAAARLGRRLAQRAPRQGSFA